MGAQRTEGKKGSRATHSTGTADATPTSCSPTPSPGAGRRGSWPRAARGRGPSQPPWGPQGQGLSADFRVTEARGNAAGVVQLWGGAWALKPCLLPDPRGICLPVPRGAEGWGAWTGTSVFRLTSELGHADLSAWNGWSGDHRWPEPVVMTIGSQISRSPALPLTTSASQGAMTLILSICPTGLWVPASNLGVSGVPPA